jgi:hypothetical protein
MPAEAGAYRFQARLVDLVPGDLAEGETYEVETFATHDFTVTTTGHATQIAVWGLPTTAERGAEVRFHVGLRCSCGCNAAGWTFSVQDGSGERLADGVTGDSVWPGTDNLYAAEVVLTVPETGEDFALTVHAQGPATPMPHGPHVESVNLRIVAPALHSIRVTVTDADTGAPVPRAKVVAHPYRTLADAEGCAVLRVAPGRYTVFASGTRYFAFQAPVEVAGDIEIAATLHHDRELTHEDMWS